MSSRHLTLSHGGDLMMSDLTIRQISVDRTKAGLRAGQCAERQRKEEQTPDISPIPIRNEMHHAQPFIQQSLPLDYVKSIHLMSIWTLPANHLRLEI